MDRRVFLRSQRWLTPCERMVTHIPPLFDGAASFHLSMAEQYQQHLGVRACDGPNAADAIHLYFASDAGVDAGQMAASVRVLSHPDDSAGEPSTSQADFMLHVCLDGHGYVVDKHQIKGAVYQPQASGITAPPHLSLILPHVTLNLYPTAAAAAAGAVVQSSPGVVTWPVDGLCALKDYLTNWVAHERRQPHPVGAAANNPRAAAASPDNDDYAEPPDAAAARDAYEEWLQRVDQLCDALDGDTGAVARADGREEATGVWAEATTAAVDAASRLERALPHGPRARSQHAALARALERREAELAAAVHARFAVNRVQATQGSAEGLVHVLSEIETLKDAMLAAELLWDGALGV